MGRGQGLRTPRPCHPGRERPRSIVLGRREEPSLGCEQNKTKLMFSTVCAVTHSHVERAAKPVRLIISQCKSQESKRAFFFLFNKKFRLYTALRGPLATRLCLAEDIVSLLFSKRVCLISQRYYREAVCAADVRPLSVCPLLGAWVTQALAGASDAGGIALGPWQQSH